MSCFYRVKKFVTSLPPLFTNFYKNCLTNLNKFIINKPKLKIFLFKFFDFMSKITYYLFIDLRLFIPFSLLCFFIVVFFSTESLYFFHYLLEKGLSFSTFKYAFFNVLNIYLQLLFVFFFVSLQIIIANMMIIQIPCIRNLMIERYGPTIIKQRGYNSPVTTALRWGAVSFVLSSGFASAAYVETMNERSQLNAYELRLKAIERQNERIMEEARLTGKNPSFIKIPEPPKSTMTTLESSGGLSLRDRPFAHFILKMGRLVVPSSK